MRLVVLLTVVFSVLFRCTPKTKVSENSSQHRDSLGIVEELGKQHPEIASPVPLLVNKVAAFFSSTERKDTFLLEAHGEALRNASVRFIIISHEGKSIYETSFGMMQAFGSGEDETSQDTSVHNLKSRFESFFDKERFRVPAIGEDWTYDSLSSPIPRYEWEAIKADSTATSFSYNLGYDAVLHLTYSREKRRAILYAVCC